MNLKRKPNLLMGSLVFVLIIHSFVPVLATSCEYTDPSNDTYRAETTIYWFVGMTSVSAPYIDMKTISINGNSITIEVGGGLSTPYNLTFNLILTSEDEVDMVSLMIIGDSGTWTAILSETIGGATSSYELFTEGPSFVITDDTLTITSTSITQIPCDYDILGQAYRFVVNPPNFVYYIDFYPNGEWFEGDGGDGGDGEDILIPGFPWWAWLLILAGVTIIVIILLWYFIFRNDIPTDPEKLKQFCQDEKNMGIEECKPFVKK